MTPSYPEPPDKSTPDFHRLFKHIARRTDLSQSAKMLYCVIVSLSAERGHCYASNAYLGLEIGLNARTARTIVAELEHHRLVLVTGATNRRQIRPAPGVPQLRPKSAIVENELCPKSAIVDGELWPKSAATMAENGHIIEKNKKEKRKESLPAAVSERTSEKTPEQQAIGRAGAAKLKAALEAARKATP